MFIPQGERASFLNPDIKDPTWRIIPFSKSLATSRKAAKAAVQEGTH